MDEEFAELMKATEQKSNIKLVIKGNAQFVQKVTFEPLMDFRKNHYVS